MSNLQNSTSNGLISAHILDGTHPVMDEIRFGQPQRDECLGFQAFLSIHPVLVNILGTEEWLPLGNLPTPLLGDLSISP